MKPTHVCVAMIDCGRHSFSMKNASPCPPPAPSNAKYNFVSEQRYGAYFPSTYVASLASASASLAVDLRPSRSLAIFFTALRYVSCENEKEENKEGNKGRYGSTCNTEVLQVKYRLRMYRNNKKTKPARMDKRKLVGYSARQHRRSGRAQQLHQNESFLRRRAVVRASSD